jgi:hypothetical protein
MKYGIYHNESVPHIDDFKDGANIIVICNVLEYISTSIKLEDLGWELRDCIKFLSKGESIQIGLFRKPFKGTVANNVLKNGCGGINIDATRITHKDPDIIRKSFDNVTGMFTNSNRKGERGAGPSPDGRFPANLILDNNAVLTLDLQCGDKSGTRIGNPNEPIKKKGNKLFGGVQQETESEGHCYRDKGGASRYFKNFETISGLKVYLRKMIDPDYENI